MVHASVVLTILIGLPFCSGSDERARPAVRPAPFIAHCGENSIYAAWRTDDGRGGLWLQLTHAHRNTKTEGVKVLSRSIFLPGDGEDCLGRFHLADGVAWLLGGGPLTLRLERCPVEDLPLFENHDAAWRLLSHKYPQHRWGAPTHLWAMEPGRDAQGRCYTRMGIEGGVNLPLIRDLFFDVCPVSVDEVLLFIVEGSSNGMRLKTWKGKGSWVGFPGEWSVKWTPTPHPAIPVPFQEPFVVMPRKSGFFLITESGKVFILDKDEGGRRTLEKAFDEPGFRMRLLLIDNDSGKIFAFGEGLSKRKEVGGAFVQIDDSVRIVTYGRLEQPGFSSADRMKSVVDHVDLLRDLGAVRRRR